MTTRPRVLISLGALAGYGSTRAYAAAILRRGRAAGWMRHHYPNGRLYISRDPHNNYTVAVERTP